MSSSEGRLRLEALLLDLSSELAEVVARRAGGALLRFETVQDLVQGAAQVALRAADAFVWHNPEAARGWLVRVVETHVEDRRRHWAALKRQGGTLLRIEVGEPSSGADRAQEPAASETGPSTFAHRRELLVLAARALELLLPRDRELVVGYANGLSTGELAQRLGLRPEAAQKARVRALDRFRKAFRLVDRSGR